MIRLPLNDPRLRMPYGSGRDGLRDPSAQHDPRVRSQIGQRGVQRRTADVVEIDIDPVGAFAPDRRREIGFGLVIDHAVQTRASV